MVCGFSHCAERQANLPRVKVRVGSNFLFAFLMCAVIFLGKKMLI